jgi:hypothetical protein
VASRVQHFAGLGAYHSGLEVHSREYSFGGHEFSSSGVFICDAKNAPGARFREVLSRYLFRRAASVTAGHQRCGATSPWLHTTYNVDTWHDMRWLQSIEIGETELSSAEVSFPAPIAETAVQPGTLQPSTTRLRQVQAIVDSLAVEFPGNSYNLLTR